VKVSCLRRFVVVVVAVVVFPSKKDFRFSIFADVLNSKCPHKSFNDIQITAEPAADEGTTATKRRRTDGDGDGDGNAGGDASPAPAAGTGQPVLPPPPQPAPPAGPAGPAPPVGGPPQPPPGVINVLAAGVASINVGGGPTEIPSAVPTKMWIVDIGGQKYVKLAVHMLSGVPESDLTWSCDPAGKVVSHRCPLPADHPFINENAWGRMDATHQDPNHARTVARRDAKRAFLEEYDGRPCYAQNIPISTGYELTGGLILDYTFVANEGRDAAIQGRNQRFGIVIVLARIRDGVRTVNGATPGARLV